MPDYEVVERHSIRVWLRGTDACRHTRTGSAAVTARSGDLQGAGNGNGRGTRRSCTAAGIVGGDAVARLGVLAEVPGGIIVEPSRNGKQRCDVSLASAGKFAAFRQPGFVKIAWTLRADPIGQNSSTFRAETRALATDPSGRILFRRY
jgi:hypothetical protein